MYDEYDEYFEPEIDEDQLKLMQIANAMGCFAGADFETALENACYMCDVDPEDLDEWDLQALQDSYM